MVNNKHNPFAYLVIVLLGIFLYGNSLSLDYALDDTLLITGNKFTKQGVDGIPAILKNDAFTGFFGEKKNLVAGGRYRPVSQIMFAIEYEFFGLNPFTGHLINIILYILLGIAIYRLLLRLLPGNEISWWFSLPFLASIFFIAHPLHTEAVANIKGRDEILSMLFAILTWTAVLKYIDKKKISQLLYASGLFFLALMSKENSITFLAIIPLSIWFFRDKNQLRKLLPTIGTLFIPTTVFLVVRYNALGVFLGSAAATEILNNPYLNARGIEEVATNLLTWGKYYSLLIFPHPLTHDYYPHFFELTGFGNILVIIALILTLGFIALALLLLRKRHIVSFSILYFFITFSIMSNVVFNIGTFMNERFMFIPLLGFTLVMAWALRFLAEKAGKTSIPVIISVVVLLGYSIKTIGRNMVWQDDYTLFTTDVRVSDNSVKCLVSAGGKSLERYEETKNEAEKKQLLNQAIPWLEKGVRLHKTYLAGWEQLGKAYFFTQEPEKAWLCYNNCLEIKPNSESARKNLGLVALMALNKDMNELAIEYLTEMREIQPEEELHVTRLAEAYINTGNPQAALEVVVQAMELMPDKYRLFGKVGELYGRYFNRLDLAEVNLNRALEINPEYVSALENLGIVYGMTGRMEASLNTLMKAHEIEPDNPRILTNIGNTLNNMGRNTEAQEYFRMAEENRD